MVFQQKTTMALKSLMMAAKFRIAITGYQISKNPIMEKLDLITGIANLVSALQKSFDKYTDIILVHGAGSALELWAGEAAIHLNLPLEIYLPFPRIKHIVRSKIRPIQAESLNAQLEYSDKIETVNDSYFYHGYWKRYQAMIDSSNMIATWFRNDLKARNDKVLKYCDHRKKQVKDLIFYSLFPLNDIHLQGELWR